MVSKFTELAVDAHEPRRVAEFWCQVLGYRVVNDEPHQVQIAGWDIDTEGSQAGPIRPTLLFASVPEGKTVKNRLHIDVNPVDRDQEAEVERLLGLGARRADIGQGQQSWVVLADPEGNEFCVLRSRQP